MLEEEDLMRFVKGLCISQISLLTRIYKESKKGRGRKPKLNDEQCRQINGWAKKYECVPYMKHKKLPQRRKERRGNDEKINYQIRRVGKSIKPLRILCDLCASAVNNIVMMFHKWDTLRNIRRT